MYDRAPRFKALHTATPARVGPATYSLVDIFDNRILGNSAPFNSTQIRTSAFENKNVARLPGPNKYRICFRKNRIVGGTSMQNRAARFKPKTSITIRGPSSAHLRYRLPGKLHTGVPPRNTTTKVSTIPEKGAEGYDVTSEGLVKVYHPPENRKIGPAEYYNPEGHQNYTTLQYQGNFWSLRTAHRFRYKESEGPGPGNYSVGQTNVCPWQQYQQMLQSEIKAQAPLMRTNDLLQQKLCREGLPGPATYSPFDPNSKKCDWGKSGTFGSSQRQDLYKKTEGPGPADYTDLRTTKSKVTSLSQAPFNVDAIRFPVLRSKSLPGPGDYTPKNTMWNDLQKRVHSKYSKWNAPFDSSSHRTTSLAKPGSCFIPSPDFYFPQILKKGDKKESSMFASGTTRDPSKRAQTSPGPAVYSSTEPFKTTSTQKSHLNNTKSAFLTSSHRLEPLKISCSPASTTYNLPLSTLNDKGCSIGAIQHRQVRDVTPGPPHYTVHPKYTKSTVFDTHNVTLQPQEKKIPNLLRVNMTKILRSFVTKG
uniref:Sperm-tail PG-rich repeat-containing protein 2 n=1 Tax=Graphocephala atropunctata TaxID=36148 RepID=A0A1B6KC36_9HEMI